MESSIFSWIQFFWIRLEFSISFFFRVWISRPIFFAREFLAKQSDQTSISFLRFSGSSFRGIRLSLDSTSLILFPFPFFANFLPTGPTNVFSRINDGALYIREFLHRRKWFPAARRQVSRFDEHTRILAPWRNAQPITSAEILSDSRSASTFVTGHGRFTSESRVAFLFLASNRHLEITTDSILWG